MRRFSFKNQNIRTSRSKTLVISHVFSWCDTSLIIIFGKGTGFRVTDEFKPSIICVAVVNLSCAK
jgi:hypothetical protein